MACDPGKAPFMDILRTHWSSFLLALLILLGLKPDPIPGPLVDPLQAARAALEAGRSEAALERIEQAIAFEPALVSLHWTAAQLAFAAGDGVHALSHLDQLPLNDGRSLERACLRSRVYLDLKKAELAVNTREDLQEECADASLFLRDLTNLHLQEGDFRSARSALEAWVGRDPTAHEPRLQLGLVTSVLQPEQALTHLRLAEELAPRSDALARALIQAIEDARVFDNKSFTLAQVGQALARAGAWELSAEAFRQALELDQGYIEVKAYLGLVLDRLGDEQGMAYLREAVQEAPRAALPKVFMALHWMEEGAFQKAKEELEEAAALEPENPAIASELGAVYSALGEVSAAKTAYRRAAALAPDEPQFWLLLAQFSLSREIELETLAIPAARNALALSSEDVGAVDALGFAHFLTGDLVLAERLLLRAYDLEPARPQTLLHLGLLRLMQGEHDRARHSLRIAAALDPYGTFGQVAQRTLDALPDG